MNEAPAETVIDVAQADFQRVVIEGSQTRPIVVDFWAPWCGPCRQLGPVLERLVNERAGAILLAKINVDEAPEIATFFRIEGIPSVMGFHGGKAVAQFVGLLPEVQVRAFLDRLMPSAVESKAHEAANLETSDPTRAEALYREALAEESEHSASLAGLARLLLARGADTEAAGLVRRLEGTEQTAEGERLAGILEFRQRAATLGTEADARAAIAKDPENAREHFDLGVILAAAQRYPEALEAMLTAATLNKALAKSDVRAAMVKIFQVIGARSEVSDAYRDKLTALLY